MAKENGLGWTTLSVDDSSGSPQAIKNDITNLTISTPRGIQDVTGIDKSAYERLQLLADASVALNGVFNDTVTTSAHAVFKTVPSTSVARTTTIVVSGDTLPNELLYNDYSLVRGTDGSLVWSATGVLADGTVPTWA
jgi:hypothetical protein